jgi:hypothetical protein
VKVVERERPAAHQKFTQDGDLVVAELEVAGLDDVDPRVGEQPIVVECECDRILDLNRRGRLQPA